MIKPALALISIIIILKVTGYSGDISEAAQSAVMGTGMLDADDAYPQEKQPDFDYNFSIKDLTGKKVALSDFKGKVIFLNLWATWCGPCRAEMPTIQKLYNTIGKENIVFVMLSLDRDQDKNKVIGYVQNKSYTFPVYQPSGYLSAQLNVPSIPTTFIISKAGKIIAQEVGTTNFNTAKFRKFLETEATR